MPTPEKVSQVEDIKARLSRCTIAIATGYQGMSASNMTDLRARLREQGIEYRVIKNTLALRAAEELGRDGVDSVLLGPTALAFGYGDASETAKGLNTYITTSRLPLVIHGAVMDGHVLTGEQVVNLATLPPRNELLSRLLGQMQAPITGLVTVLSAPLRELVTVLQRASELGERAPAATADTVEAAAAAEEPAAAVTVEAASEEPAADTGEAAAEEPATAEAVEAEATAEEPTPEATEATDEEPAAEAEDTTEEQPEAEAADASESDSPA